MFTIETLPLRGREAERFKIAFYRFLETNPPPAEESAWLEALRIDGGERQCARLWSQEAADAFKTYAANFRLGPRRMRVGRFDDLGL